MDDKELTRRIVRLDAELKVRRRKNRILYYNTETVHRKQVEFHRCQKRNRWVFGGNRSGKTECGAAIFRPNGQGKIVSIAETL